MNRKTETGIERYGRVWKIQHPAVVELALYARADLREIIGKRALSAADHLREAIRILYPPEIFRLNPWSNRIIDGWCEVPMLTVWGCTGSGKSTTMGMIALMDLLAAPKSTYTCLVTSPAKEHPNRSWGAIVRFYAHLPDALKPGIIKQVPLGLHTVGNQEGKRAGIHCYSTEDGESVEDFKKRVGAHQARNRFIVDEVQKCSESVASAFTNLGSVGEYREAFICNPASWFGVDGKVSMPKAPLTTKEIDERELDTWQTARSFRGLNGRVEVLDGARSPALKDESLASILIDRQHLDTIRENSGEDSFEFWSQGRGRMAPEGAVSTFITRRDLEDAGAFSQADYSAFQSYHEIAGLDPSEGRDDCIYVRALVGTCLDGIQRIAILAKPQVKIRLKSGDISGQISEQFVGDLRRWNLPIRQAALDSTGGGAQADRIEQDYGSTGILRIYWQGPPTKRKTSPTKQVAADIYADHATELFANTCALARQGRILGIDEAIAHQMTTRRKLIRNGRSKVEEKDDWRDRNGGRSPNDLDALICAVELACQRHHLKPFLPISSRQFPGQHLPAQAFFDPRSSNGKISPFAQRIRRASQIAAKR